MTEENKDGLRVRLELLEQFRKTLRDWKRLSGGDDEGDETANARRLLLRNLVAVKETLKAVGVSTVSIDNLFSMNHGRVWVADATDRLDEAIGIYEHLRQDTGLIRLASARGIDVEAAIERALRASFRGALPRDDAAVKDAVEIILLAAGVEFTREPAAAPAGPRVFRPDFIVASEDLAITIRVPRGSMTESDLTAELEADIAACRARWKRLLVVVYDGGIVRDPLKLRRESMKHFGVTVLVVKH
jgi:hypothetical protein